MKPTAEQTLCADYFHTEKALRINAYAGTGKTTTLTQLAKGTKRRGVYLAFNKSIADDASRKFPRTVSCSTVHAMAFRAMRNRFSADKMTGNISGGYLVKRFGLKGFFLGGSNAWELGQRTFGVLVANTIGRFLRSGDMDLRRYHVPHDGFIATLPDELVSEVESHVITKASQVWAEMRDPRSDMPLTHDGYLHLWVISNPVLPGDFVLLDEAQDTNGIVLRLVREQSSQIVAVGDRWQQLYEWRGAQNAMTTLPSELVARLAKSFRFGECLANFASRTLMLLGENVPLVGNGDMPSRVGHVEAPNAILARTNANAIGEVVAALDRGQRPVITGGTRAMLTMLDAIEGLQAGVESTLPELIGFKTWREVQEAAEQPEGLELRMWVRLIDKFGLSALKDALESLPQSEADADLIVSTAHKSKGREWSSVVLCDDFLPAPQAKQGQMATPAAISPAELMLFYVASTRARTSLDVPAVVMDRLKQAEAGQLKQPATA